MRNKRSYTQSQRIHTDFKKLKGNIRNWKGFREWQILARNTARNRTINGETNPKCRLCREYDESIEDIAPECPTLAGKECLERHDKTRWWYDNKPITVVTGTGVVLWDMPVHYDKENTVNRTDIVIEEITGEFPREASRSPSITVK